MTRAAATLLVSFLLPLLCSTLAEAQPPKPATEPPLLFRREYVPKSLLDRDAKGLIPVKRTEFDSLLKAAQVEGQAGVPRLWVALAEFEAQPQEDQIVGKARLHIESESPITELLELPQFRFLVREAKWEGETARAATFGAAENGKVYVVVDRPGILAFDWVLPARRNAWNDVTFDFPVLEASRTTLTVDLPTDRRLDTSGGIVRSSPADTPDRQRWQVDLGGNREARIRLAATTSVGAVPAVLVRENATCKVLADELEMQSHFRLDIYRHALPRMELELLGGWAPTEIRQGDKRVPFEVVVREGQPSLAVVHFDPPLEGVNRRLSISGKQAIASEVRVQVPRARIAGSIWLEGRMSIQPGGTWELRHWELSKALPAPSVVAGESTASQETHWQLQEPEAQIAFTTRRRPTQLKVAGGVTTRIDEEAATSRVVCDFTATGDPIFHLEGELDPSWILDSIETVPAQRLEDWEVTAEAGRQLLKIKLRDSVQVSGGVRLIVLAHCTPPSRNELPARQLRPIRWQADESQGQVAVVVDSRWQAEMTGAELVRLDPASLQPREADRLQLSEEVSLLVDEASLESSLLKLVEEPVKFSAHWESTVAAEARQIRQEVRLRVEPDTSLIERFKVLVKPAAGKDCVWKLEGEDVAPLEARLLRSGDAALDEEWEILLRRPRRTPFTITASLSTRERQQYVVPLFRCVEARRETADITLLAGDSGSLVGERLQGMEPIWPSVKFAGAIAAWRYDPSQATSLILRPASAAELGQLLSIERAALRTKITDQELLHEVTYLVRCQQPQTMQLVLPDGAIYEEALLKDQRTDVRVAENTVSVWLPRLLQPTELIVRFRSPQNSRWAVSRISSAWPVIGKPVSRQTWHLVVPNRYRAWHVGADEPTTGQWITRRLCGPLPGFEATSADDRSPAEDVTFELAFDNAAALPKHVILLRYDTLVSVSWSASLLAWLTIGIPAWSRRHMAAVLLVLGFAALSIPPAVDPLGRMLLLGVLLGLVTQWWRGGRSLVAHREERGSTDARVSAPAVATVCLLVLGLAALSRGMAQDETGEKSTIHRVVSPVDDKGNEVDDYLYMSERFFAELFARTKREAPSGPAYLILDASYRAFPTANAKAFERMEGNLRVDVIRAPAVVKIPCSRAACLIDSEQFRLNDRVVPVRWSTEEDALSVTISTPGEHRIQFTAHPGGEDEESSFHWDVRFPTTPFTRLVVDRLGGGADVRVSRSFVKPRLTFMSDGLEADLAFLSTTSLMTRPYEEEESTVAAEQLLWVNLWPGATVVEGRWRFRAEDRALEAASIEWDGDLELIATNANVPATSRRQNVDGKSTLAWVPRDAADEMVVEASFVWKHAATGDRVLPRIEPLAARVEKRWLAVDTFDPEQRRRLAAENRNLLDVQTFASIWNAEIAPAHVRHLDSPGPVRLSLPAATNRPTYDATTAWEIGPAEARFSFTAQLQSVDQPVGTMRLHVPQDCQIDFIEIGVAGQYRSATWLSIAADEILLLPMNSLQAGNIFRLQGTLPVVNDQEQNVVWPSIKNATLLRHTADIWRKPTVQVNVSTTDPAARRDPLPAAAAPPHLLPVARLHADGTATLPLTMQWQVRANHPRTVGILVTTAQRDGEQWRARLDAYLAVRDGRVDSFRFESPAHWLPTELLEGQGTLETISDDEGVRTFQVHPQEGVRDRFHFACEAVIAGSSTQKVELPQIRLLGAEATQSFLRLPMGAEFDWSITGVQESPLPNSIMLPGDNFAVYRAVVPQYRAMLNSRDASPVAAEIVAAHLATAQDAEEQRLLTAVMTVKPIGRATLPIRLPASARFLRARVEGQSMISQLVGHREIEIPLRSSRLPQMVEVVYTMPQENAAAPPEVLSRTQAWRFARPWQASALNEPSETSLTPPELVALLQPALREASSEAQDSTWAGRWLARVQKAAQDGSLDETHKEPLNSIEKELERLAEGANGVEVTPLLPQTASTLAVEEAELSNAALVGWMISCVGWLGLVLLGTRLSAVDAVIQWAQRWPYLCAVLTGGLLAVLISPFWLGAGLMLVAAAGSLAWPWRALPRL